MNFAKLVEMTWHDLSTPHMLYTADALTKHKLMTNCLPCYKGKNTLHACIINIIYIGQTISTIIRDSNIPNLLT